MFQAEVVMHEGYSTTTLHNPGLTEASLIAAIANAEHSPAEDPSEAEPAVQSPADSPQQEATR